MTATAASTAALSENMTLEIVSKHLADGAATPEQVTTWAVARLPHLEANGALTLIQAFPFLLNQVSARITELQERAAASRGGFGNPGKPKSSITNLEFLAQADVAKLDFNGTVLKAKPKEFTTGNVGWNANAKIEMRVGGKLVWCQVNTNITVLR